MTTDLCTELVSSLENSARDALETMCFFGVLGPASDPALTDDLECVGLRFYGDATGKVELVISSGALAEITANFFGEEYLELEAGQTEAVACELANMVCGAALSEWKPDGHFELTQPEPIPVLSQDTTEPTVRLVLDLENGKLAVSIWME